MRINTAEVNIKIKAEQKNKMDELKVHERQAYHEIVGMLLDFYEQYNRAVENDVEQWK